MTVAPKSSAKKPAFNPTQYAEARREKLERAERLRAEQKLRMQAEEQRLQQDVVPVAEAAAVAAPASRPVAKRSAAPPPWACDASDTDRPAEASNGGGGEGTPAYRAKRGAGLAGASPSQRKLAPPWAEQGDQHPVPHAAEAPHRQCLATPWAADTYDGDTVPPDGCEKGVAMAPARVPASAPWAEDSDLLQGLPSKARGSVPSPCCADAPPSRPQLSAPWAGKNDAATILPEGGGDADTPEPLLTRPLPAAPRCDSDDGATGLPAQSPCGMIVSLRETPPASRLASLSDGDTNEQVVDEKNIKIAGCGIPLSAAEVFPDSSFSAAAAEAADAGRDDLETGHGAQSSDLMEPPAASSQTKRAEHDRNEIPPDPSHSSEACSNRGNADTAADLAELFHRQSAGQADGNKVRAFSENHSGETVAELAELLQKDSAAELASCAEMTLMSALLPNEATLQPPARHPIEEQTMRPVPAARRPVLPRPPLPQPTVHDSKEQPADAEADSRSSVESASLLGGIAASCTGGESAARSSAPATSELTALFDGAFANPSGETGLLSNTSRSSVNGNPLIGSPSDESTLRPGGQRAVLPRPPVLTPDKSSHVSTSLAPVTEKLDATGTPLAEFSELLSRAIEVGETPKRPPSAAWEIDVLTRRMDMNLEMPSPDVDLPEVGKVSGSALEDHPRLEDDGGEAGYACEAASGNVDQREAATDNCSKGQPSCWDVTGGAGFIFGSSEGTSKQDGVDGSVEPSRIAPSSGRGGEVSAWWADGPEPAWMRNLQSEVPQSASGDRLAEPIADATKWLGKQAKSQDSAPTSAGRSGEASALDEDSDDPQSFQKRDKQDREIAAGRSREGSVYRDDASDWLSELRGTEEDDALIDDDPLVFGKPKAKPKSKPKQKIRRQPLAGRSREGSVSAEDQSEYLQGLRGASAEELDCEDPLVFGPPRPKPKVKPTPPRSCPRSRSAAELATPSKGREIPLPDEHSLDTRNRLSGPRGSVGDDEDDDPDVWKKPKSQPLQRRAPRRPPRPAAADSLGSSAGSVSHPSRPGSGGSRKEGGVGQLPDKLRKKLEQRSHEREPHKRGRSERPLSEDALHERRDGPGSSRAESPGDDVKLPLLGPDRGSRERRCSSQPPVGDKGQRRKEKKQARPRSTGGKVQGGGDGGDEEGGRQMFDKNTLRTNNREVFMTVVERWRDQNIRKRAADEQEDEDDGSEGQLLRVYLRKRPIFEKEMNQRGDFDISTILPPSTATVHNCLFQADLKTAYVQHVTFTFDHVFHEGADSEDVYDAAASQLVGSTLDGGLGTMFMFGQTGSGKTHTMSAIQRCASRDLFADTDGIEPWLSVQFIELRGNRVFDLLAPGISDGRRHNLRPELRLREQSDGSYSADGAVDLYPGSPEELCNVMEMAASRRATSATDANSVSSRSHAVCILRLCQSEGQLLLVDCAGTERKKDSMWHSKERQQEGAEINASLHALKECIRYLTGKQKVPSHAYRASSLTKVLADSFVHVKRSRLAAVCTVSPCATDTEHTISTMKMGMVLGGRGDPKEEKVLLADVMPKKERRVHPKQWTPEQVVDWITTVADGRLQDALDNLPSNFTGQMLVRLTEARCVQLCGGNERRGRSLFDHLHQEMDKVDASRRAR